MNFVWTWAMLEALMTAATQAASGAAGPIHAVFAGLYVGPTPAPSVNRVIGDITEPGYTGYARQAIVWGAEYRSTGGLLAINGGSLTWQPSDAVAPATITGVFIASLITAGVLLGMAQLDTPVPLPDALSSMDTIITQGLSGAGSYGTVTVVT